MAKPQTANDEELVIIAEPPARMAAAGEAGVHPRCATCIAFAAPDWSGRDPEKLQRAGINVEMGSCKLNPAAVPKALGDWCLQHKPRTVLPNGKPEGETDA